jgi:hypothetical protein
MSDTWLCQSMFPKPCPCCDKTDFLKPKWNSDTGEKWVHCDNCGRVGNPSYSDPVGGWNQKLESEDDDE